MNRKAIIRLSILMTALLLFILGCSEVSNQMLVNEVATPGTTPSMRIYTRSAETVTWCGMTEVTIFAGQTIDVGTLTILNDEDKLVLVIDISDDWMLVEYHLHFGKTVEDIPHNRNGTPIPGQFMISGTTLPEDGTLSYTLAELEELTELEFDLGDDIIIAFHAVVQMKGTTEEEPITETAWSDGEDFPTKRWSTYTPYTIEECGPGDPEDPVGDFRTQTQGGWGSAANGNNPGTYRDANFDETFLPEGLVIGTLTGNSATFTSSAAVEAFLPAGGTADMLTMDYLNPSTTSAGVLAGQVVALSLSVYFDLADDDFGASNINLKDLKVRADYPLFGGMTVMEVLDAANNYLGNGTGIYSASQLNDVVSSINENYVDGTDDLGFLTLP